ncbi:hypothetical protein ACIQGZ_17285 [Streptomyces sp. NPDC092296]|uniref:hypothetical protein n=1 Tax=Streptomyces sp. NPDC092296 TaxID=3366012 RepID=UPI00381963CF
MTTTAPEPAFTCPACSETYQPLWRDPGGTKLCRACAAGRAGRCQYDDHPGHLSDHPCSYGTESPGGPCRYCGDPVPADGPCARCWQPMSDLSTAGMRALFAADGMFTLGPPRPTPPSGQEADQ